MGFQAVLRLLSWLTVIRRKARQGRTKKHGAGGKFTWGTYNNDDLIPPEDPADPNYNSEEDKSQNGHSPSTKASQALQHKRAVSLVQPGCQEAPAPPSADIHVPAVQITLLIAEYYDSGDMHEAAEALKVSMSDADLAVGIPHPQTLSSVSVNPAALQCSRLHAEKQALQADQISGILQRGHVVHKVLEATQALHNAQVLQDLACQSMPVL